MTTVDYDHYDCYVVGHISVDRLCFRSIPHAEAFHTEAAVLLAPSLDLSDVVDDGNEMDSLPAASDFSQVLRNLY